MTDVAQTVRDLLQLVDLNRPGAAEAVAELRALKKPDIAKYREVVKAFPLEFHGGIRPVSQENLHRALAALKKSRGGDKALLAIRTGADVGFGNPARLSWGNANLNYVTCGGAPRGRIMQVQGPPQHGKTYACQQLVQETLRMGGCVVWVAMEPFDSDWARICGIPVHFTGLECALDPIKQKYNDDNPAGERFTVIVGRQSNDVLQAVVNLVALNVWDLVVIDSINVTVSDSHLEKNEVGDVLPGGEAITVNQFVTRVQIEFNGVEAYVGRAIEKSYVCKSCANVFKAKSDHEKCEQLERGKPKFEESARYGERPRTAVVVVAQQRAKGIGSNSKMPIPPGAVMGHGMDHYKGIDVEFHGRTKLQSDASGYAETYGSIAQVRTVKNKCGVPDRIGVVEFWTHTIPGVSVAGRYNLMTDLAGAKVTFGKGPDANTKTFESLGERAGLITTKGSWMYLGTEKFQGQAELQNYLVQNPTVCRALQAELDAWIRSQS